MENEPKNYLNDWKEYHEFAGEKHSSSLEKAIEYCKEKDEALDIGAGNLRDTNYLLSEGFTVTAIDPSPNSKEIAEKIENPQLKFVQEVIGKWNFPEDYFSLVNAQGILFHFEKDRFEIIMKKIKASLKASGIFCGNFLGKNDSWNIENSNKTFLSKEEIGKLFEGFDIKLEEIERDSPAAYAIINQTNELKHWHWIKVIAIKR